VTPPAEARRIAGLLLAAGLSQGELQRIEENFLTSSRYEHAFWEMAYRQEQWLV